MPLLYLKQRKARYHPAISGNIYWDRAKTHPTIALLNDNRTMYGTVNSGWISGITNAGKSTGKFVLEYVRDAMIHSLVGFSTVSEFTTTTGYLGAYSNSACLYWSQSPISILAGSGITKQVSSLGPPATVTDVFAIAFNMDIGSAFVFKNGVIQNAGNPVWTGLLGKTIYPAGSTWTTGSKFTANFTTDTMVHSYPGYVGIGD